jgi:NitT/TauT family transport system ATP-binding protein
MSDAQEGVGAVTGTSVAGAVRTAPAKISLKGLGKEFRTGKGAFRALAPLDLEIERGQFVTVVGPSGCGKSTLLRILAGLETASEGTVSIQRDGTDKPLTSVIFQEESIFPWMTVAENVGYGLQNRKVDRRLRSETVDFWVDKVGLGRFRDSYPHQLSGGMKQRVSVARAFANDPEVLLMDEPFSALDEQNRTILQQELIRIWEESGKTVIFVTHSIDEALTLSDDILLMTASPGHIKDRIRVGFERPRDVVAIRATREYGQMQQHIWQRLIGEVEEARRKERGA